MKGIGLRVSIERTGCMVAGVAGIKKVGVLAGFVAITLVLGCSKEPTYESRPLNEWASFIQQQHTGELTEQEKKAIEAVHTIGPSKAVPFLLKWIPWPYKDSTRFPSGAIGCFRLFGPEAKAAIPALERMLTQPRLHPDTLHNASEALSYLGAEAVPALLRAATNWQRAPKFQWVILGNMANLGTNGGAAKPAILNWSRDPDEWVRLGALHAYVGIEDDKAAKTAFLIAALHDPSGRIRTEATQCLGEAGQGREEALPVLIQIAKNPGDEAQEDAIAALGKLRVGKDVVLHLLSEKLHDAGNARLRHTAACALRDLGGKEAYATLKGATADPDPFVREAVLYSMQLIDPDEFSRSGLKF